MTSMPLFGRSHPRFGDVYRTVISHVISGETVGMEHYAQMIPIARTLDERLQLLEDAWSEKRHLMGMLAVAGELGVTPRSSIADEYWGKVRAAFRSRAVAGDLASCYVIQDIVLECLAVTFYEALVPGLEAPVAARLKAIAEDEREHLAHGTATVAAYFAEDAAGLARCVDYANEHAGRTLSEWMRPRDCDPVCGVCTITRGSCFKEDLTLLEVDLAATRGRFTALYGKALRDVGFAPGTVTHWMARLAP
jgi:fatty aldehyde decarbonylase